MIRRELEVVFDLGRCLSTQLRETQGFASLTCIEHRYPARIRPAVDCRQAALTCEVELLAVARLMSTELTVTISEEQITRRLLVILVPPFPACMSPVDICAKVATASSNPTAGTPRLRSSVAGSLAADRTTSLEGFECGIDDHHERRSSDGVFACLSVTASPLRSLSDRARYWHDVANDGFCSFLDLPGMSFMDSITG